MLNALSVALRGADPAGCTRAAQSFVRQGFVRAAVHAWPGGELTAWAHPSQSGVANAWLDTPAGLACCVGPLWYRGRFGTDALGMLLDEFDADFRADELALSGNFALFLHKGDACVLVNDALGFVRVYASEDGSFHGTSWLAACAYAGGVDVDAAAAAEYVLLGASHSDATVARGIATLPLGRLVDLGQRRTTARFPAPPFADKVAPKSLADAIRLVDARLREISTHAARAFPGRIRTALSGGFDSRLIIAGLLAVGARPDLFVYGSPASDDVRIAMTVAAGAGLPLEVIDKQERSQGRALPDLARLVRNALFFDGLPNDGVYDTGIDEETRLEQMAGGYLAPNGGGGEIFRNYFHLPDRSFHARDIVRTFYRGFDPRVFRSAGELRAYEVRMAAAMRRVLEAVGCIPGQRLSRSEVELLYPLFRCHHWMAVNNSVAVRHGYYTTPLIELATVRLACALPLAWKNAGRLESRLIAGLHRGVAEQPSAYGFRFADGPNLRARFNEWTTRARPVAARPFIGALHRRLAGQAVAPDMITRCRALLPGEWRLDPTLDLRRLPDNGAFGRALAVEVVWRELLT